MALLRTLSLLVSVCAAVNEQRGTLPGTCGTSACVHALKPPPGQLRSRNRRREMNIPYRLHLLSGILDTSMTEGNIQLLSVLFPSPSHLNVFDFVSTGTRRRQICWCRGSQSLLPGLTTQAVQLAGRRHRNGGLRSSIDHPLDRVSREIFLSRLESGSGSCFIVAVRSDP